MPNFNATRTPLRAALWLGTFLVLAMLLLLLPKRAYAANINVDGATCTLPEAIEAANTNASFGGCAAGSGASDTLLITTTQVLTTIDNNTDGNNATPSITTTIIISGGVGGAIVERVGGGPSMRLFHVGATGDLTLEKVTLRNGLSDLDAGAIYNRNRLTLLNSWVTSNRTDGRGGGIYNFENSTATLTNTQVTSNAASFGGGIYDFTGATVTLTGSHVTSNTVNLDGGGIYNNGSTVTLTNSQFSANKSLGGGGGIFNRNGTTTLSGSQVFANKATTGFGGGILNTDGTTTLTNTQVTSNTALFGGGIYNYSNGTATLNSSQVSTNTAAYGGGIYNLFDSTAKLTGSRVSANTATVDGGGIYNFENSTATLTNTKVISNTAKFGSGGGIYNFTGAIAALTGSGVTSNTATTGNGGGIFNLDNSTATFSNTQVTSNTAALGGGIYNEDASTVSLSGSQLLANGASQGGALYQKSGLTSIVQSCIVNNTDRAVQFVNGAQIVAINNWWGAPDGPSGVGPGSGDSVSINVTFAPFSAAPLLGCPSRPAQVSFSKAASPSGTLLPGQPLTFTLTITNELDLSAENLHVSDTLPVGFIVSQVISTGQVINAGAGRFTIAELPPSQGATIAFGGQIDPALAGDTTVTNTAILTSSLIGTLTASAAVNVALPLLNWSSATYSAAEASGSIPVTVTITPPQLYVTVTVEATYTDSAALLASAGVLTVTFPPGSSSAQAIVPIVNDEVVNPRTILLGLQSPSGAKIGSDSSATILINEDDVVGLAVEKNANPAQAEAGELITYSYRITNTGNVTLTISGVDDPLGAVGGLAGPLGGGDKRSATLTYTVQAGDPLGPLTNVVIVTGTDEVDNDIVVSDTATVNIQAVTPPPTLGLVVVKQADRADAVAGDKITYSYAVTNTGDVTLSLIAGDDRLGPISGLAGDLAPGPGRSTTLTYTVQASDPLGPLVNRVMVTGTLTGINAVAQNTVVASDTATVNIQAAPLPALGLVVEKSANLSQAAAGDTLIYSYVVTNTGEVTLSIAAVDDPLGAVGGLAGDLAPGLAASATLTYTVKASDPLGPLTNTVTVTGTDPSQRVITAGDSVTVNIAAQPRPETLMPVIKRTLP